jgi:hypothetical protein
VTITTAITIYLSIGLLHGTTAAILSMALSVFGLGGWKVVPPIKTFILWTLLYPVLIVIGLIAVIFDKLGITIVIYKD